MKNIALHPAAAGPNADSLISDGARKLRWRPGVRSRLRFQQVAQGAVDSAVASCEGGRGLGSPALRHFCTPTDLLRLEGF